MKDYGNDEKQKKTYGKTALPYVFYFLRAYWEQTMEKYQENQRKTTKIYEMQWNTKKLRKIRKTVGTKIP